MSIPWWKNAVIYQIYPRSFQDANGDGIGDLKGIESRLDYLDQTLGVDAIWLSPIFPSPMADFGYDVADYTGVDSSFGTLEDVTALISALHSRGIKLILDFVPNHSSNQHPWFIESRSSRANPKRDWYIWRDPASDGGPPNNWISDFGGPAWSFDETSGQYYLHAFLKEQPDLNWRNLEVRAAMMDVLRFWLDLGVDGFRIDVLWHLIKADGLPHNPSNPDYRHGMGEMHKVLQTNSTDQPEVHDIAADMRRLADSYPGDRVLIGEIYLPLDRLVQYYGSEAVPETQLPFNFELIQIEWSPETIGSFITAYEAALPSWGWPNWVLGNHDRPRIAARVGEAQARVAAILVLTLRGTPTLYYADELGLGHVEIPRVQVHDPRELREPGLGLGRDPVRTPMPWDGSNHGGFSQGSAWLPHNADWRSRNVEAELSDPSSMLWLYKRLLALRRQRPALQLGAIKLLKSEGGILAFERHWDNERLIVVLNFGEDALELELPSWAIDLEVLISTLDQAALISGGELHLGAHEAVILAERSAS